jgi:hypothetical protein
MVDVVEGLYPVQVLKPRAKDEALPSTCSGKFGRAEFPLRNDLAHWDLPPRFGLYDQACKAVVLAGGRLLISLASPTDWGAPPFALLCASAGIFVHLTTPPKPKPGLDGAPVLRAT